jgi:hypothetical protein
LLDLVIQLKTQRLRSQSYSLHDFLPFPGTPHLNLEYPIVHIFPSTLTQAIIKPLSTLAFQELEALCIPGIDALHLAAQLAVQQTAHLFAAPQVVTVHLTGGQVTVTTSPAGMLGISSG